MINVGVLREINYNVAKDNQAACMPLPEIQEQNRDFYFILFYWPRLAACGILVPQPGIEPVPPAVEARILNHWTTREVPKQGFLEVH